MRGSVIIAATAIGALVVAGCSSNSTTASGGAGKACVATIGIEGPLTGPLAVLGQEQLQFAQLALAMDNQANKTKISLIQGDTTLNAAQATTVTQQFTSNPKIVAAVGPAGSQEVEAVGSLMARAGLAFISGGGRLPRRSRPASTRRSSGSCRMTACRDRRTPTTSCRTCTRRL